MLSPDNYISNAGYTQGYNRYSYAKNNPLLYTDPDGNNPIIGAIIGAASYTLGVAFSKGGFKNWNWFGFASSVVIGTMTGGFAAEVGGAVSAAVEAGKLSLFGAGAIQVGAYAAFGGTTSMLTGGSFLSGALTGAAGSAVGSLTGLIPGIQTNGWGTTVQVGSSAAFGGIVAELSGGNFWNGAAQAAIIAGFNHTAPTIYERIAATAEKYIGSDDWAYETEKDNFRIRTNKCNKFVYDVLREAGAETKFTRYGLSYDLVPLSKDRPYLAGEWGNPDAVVTNWKVIRNPRRGDIAAYKAPYSEATGHVGIVTGSGKGVWANGFVIRQDYINNKVWDTSHTIIYRRYVGPAK